MKFNDLIDGVTDGKPFVMAIKDKAKKAIFCAIYYTEHYPDEEYFRVFSMMVKFLTYI